MLPLTRELRIFLTSSVSSFFCPEILDEDLYDMLDSASRRRAIIPDGIGTFVKMFDITDGYIAWPPDIRADQPHVIIMIDHKYPGDDMISRAEILAIIAVIMTQLQHENLAEHCIIPVRIFNKKHPTNLYLPKFYLFM